MRIVSEQPSLASQTIAGATACTGMAAFPSASDTRDPAAGCILVYPTGEMVFTRMPCSDETRAHPCDMAPYRIPDLPAAGMLTWLSERRSYQADLARARDG